MALKEIALEIEKLFKQEGIQTLVFTYFAGHGAMDQYTKCVLNGSRMYPLERQLRIIAKANGSYVISVFDCCREIIMKNFQRGMQLPNMMDDNDDDDFEMEDISQHNFMVTFGCQPTDGVAQKSTIAKGYFRYLRMMANVSVNADNVGRIKLPKAIQLFKGTDKKCETLCAIEQYIYLDWHDKVRCDDGCDKFATKSNFFNAAAFK